MDSSNVEPAQLAKVVDGKSDAEINKAFEGKYEQVCSQIGEAMKVRFVPQNAAGQTAVIQYDITAPDGVHTFQLKVADGKCDLLPGKTEPARVTLAFAFPDLLRFVAGKLDGMQAFFTGKLKLSGDVVFAQAVQKWFAR